ncbi:hypothetical protein DRO69_07175 [Candidatus Bathyarchaeota archaeon]|nr:MAG: hypothetical protein DRO69_07175 [Candidatus Bathyarchaeota archaeon]
MGKDLLSPDGAGLLNFLRSNHRRYRDTLDIFRDVYKNRERFHHYYRHSGVTVFRDILLCPLLRWDLEVLMQLKVIEKDGEKLKINPEKLNQLIRSLK